MQERTGIFYSRGHASCGHFTSTCHRSTWWQSDHFATGKIRWDMNERRWYEADNAYVILTYLHNKLRTKCDRVDTFRCATNLTLESSSHTHRLRYSILKWFAEYWNRFKFGMTIFSATCSMMMICSQAAEGSNSTSSTGPGHMLRGPERRTTSTKTIEGFAPNALNAQKTC